MAAFFEGFADSVYRNLIQGSSFLAVLNGLWATVRISALSLLLGTLLGALVCAARMCRVRIIRLLAGAWIAFLRGTPVLLLLMLMYYVVFARSRMDAVYVAVAAFSLNVGAHIAEVMRAAMGAVDRGQVEAARTLGFSRFEAFRLIALPQAARHARPVYQSTIVNLIQWTSVVGYVTITDLTRAINNIGARTMDPFFMIFLGMLLYLLMAYAVFGLFALIERRKKVGG